MVILPMLVDVVTVLYTQVLAKIYSLERWWLAYTYFTMVTLGMFTDQGYEAGASATVPQKYVVWVIQWMSEPLF